MAGWTDIWLFLIVTISLLGSFLLVYYIIKYTILPWADLKPPVINEQKYSCNIDLTDPTCTPLNMLSYCNNVPTLDDSIRCDAFCDTLPPDICEYAYYCGKVDEIKRMDYIISCVKQSCRDQLLDHDADIKLDTDCSTEYNNCFDTLYQLSECSTTEMSVLCTLTNNPKEKEICSRYCKESLYSCSHLNDSDKDRNPLNLFCPNYIDKELCEKQKQKDIKLISGISRI
jgi:hypothetical protein